MFSRCDHHDQKAPGGFLAPQPSYSAPFPLEAHQEPHPDLLSAHHRCLESLLDSALATLTLIHDIAPLRKRYPPPTARKDQQASLALFIVPFVPICLEIVGVAGGGNDDDEIS
ncbi:hypothetical protein B0H13DRAFT_2319557 [Mycena leptocephala]|nr:hypothetical protein B0H13DRAFT_2319557 [Mycena leptocephala]